jgi:predicted permease
VEDVPSEPGIPPPVIEYAHVTDGYFETLGIPLLAGRTLERADQERPTGAVVVCQTFANHYWPTGSALGKRIQPAGQSADSWHTIVGIVGDVRNHHLAEEPREIVYYPMLGANLGAWTTRHMSVALRTHIQPELLVAAVRKEIWKIDPDLPIADVGTMQQLARQDKAGLTFSLLIFLFAAGVALALGAVGLYGFVAYMVSQRTAEIGIRIAIGARAGNVRWMILKEALGVGLAGILAGILGSAALTRWLQSLLFDTSPLDPITFVATPFLLIILVFLASYLPAERAAQVDPLQALQRFE